MTPPVTMSQASRPATGLNAFFLRAHVRFHPPTDVSRLSHLCSDVLPGQAQDGDFLVGGWLGVNGT